jgi:hypothetical protein
LRSQAALVPLLLNYELLLREVRRKRGTSPGRLRRAQWRRGPGGEHLDGGDAGCAGRGDRRAARVRQRRGDRQPRADPGTLGTYSVHLGSGTVHRRPGNAVCIIPVGAQHRGRLFLPLVDDDPRRRRWSARWCCWPATSRSRTPRSWRSCAPDRGSAHEDRRPGDGVVGKGLRGVGVHVFARTLRHRGLEESVSASSATRDSSLSVE